MVMLSDNNNINVCLLYEIIHEAINYANHHHFTYIRH